MEVIKSHTTEILITIFFVITYCMSVIEKLADWKGTLTYYKLHFKDTILVNFIPFLLIKVVVIEIVTLIFLLYGLYFIFTNSTFEIAKLGFIFSAITLLIFLFAQRIAKDYSGAMNITVYFILNCFGIYLLT